MKKPHYSEAARADLQEILDYIAQDNPRRARTYVAELQQHARRIAANPGAYRLREEFGTEVRVAVHGNHLIFFSNQNDDVLIERVLHAARNLDFLRP